MIRTPKLRWRALGTALTALIAMLGIATAGMPAHGSPGAIIGAERRGAVAGSYIVVLRESATADMSVSAQAQRLATRHRGTIGFIYTTALHGFSVRMSAMAARRLAADRAVAYVEQDRRVRVLGVQPNPPSWGLDRVDQRNLPLDRSYTYPTTAANVHAYIIDTGIRVTHTDFGGRASVGFDAVGDGRNGNDCHGHGTHVAGTTGGTSYGVAKGVQLVAVRVLDCAGSGTIAQVVAGVDWVTNNSVKPAVANMSLGGSVSSSLDTAVSNSIASGVTYAVAAGNSNANACNFSPARVPSAITLGATNISDGRASFSNFGSCLDLFAPGVTITSAWHTSNTAINMLSGTSMASPHAAGAAALIAAAHPAWTPQQVRDQLVADATTGVVVGPGTGSPNRLLFVKNVSSGKTIYRDTFESATGWTTNPNGTDTATTGRWERGDPEATSYAGVALQLGTTVSGSNDLVAGRLAGAGAGTYDVDGGVTSIQSPAITLPSTGTLTLSFSWYLAHLSNAGGADFFNVSVVTGSTAKVVFQKLGSAADRAGAWSTGSVSMSGFAGQTIRLRITAADASTASLIEAGVDDVSIVQS